MDVLRVILFPFACLYGLLMVMRGKFFDWKILPCQSFSVAVISVGNLSYGGTGKTPMVEYLIRLLGKNNKVATLSRGYKRQTRGFVLATEKSTFEEIGDEPLQYKTKFKEAEVAVHENRIKGIYQLLNTFQELDVVLLDDAYQHRYVKPGYSILLTDFHKLYVNDYPLPAGTLREFRSGAKRADMIIVTKTPGVLSPITRRRITALIKPRIHQQLLFSYISYAKPVPICKKNEGLLKDNYNTILLFSGVANSYPLQEHLQSMCQELHVMDFMDHHKYTRQDLEKIKSNFDNMFTRNKIIFTTEKDAMRLDKSVLREVIKNMPIFYIPIKFKFHNGDNIIFDDQIREYVEKDTGNQQLSEG
jgi:tetraacyldisaccharide 4'-kinase